MTNTALFQTMIQKYNSLSYTHNYIFGFEFGENIYSVTATSEILPYVLKLDRASRGAGMSLRFKPTVEQKTFLLTQGATVICSKEFFKESVKSSKYNKGEIFEKMITENFNQTWVKDNVPFYKDGDVTANGIAYQIKFQSATFTTEKQLMGLN